MPFVVSIFQHSGLPPAKRAGIVHRLLGSILLLASLGADAASGVTAGFDPSWEGRYLPGRASEVRVHLPAEAGGRFELVLESRSGRTVYTGILEAETPQDLWLPLIPHPGEPVAITLSLDGETTIQHSLSFTPSPAPLTVYVETIDPERFASLSPPPPSPSLLETTFDRLPRTGDGYQSVGTLILSPDTLTRLDAMQLAALRDYIGNCGTLLLTRSNAFLLDRLRGVAGCGGGFVGLTNNRDTTRDSFPPPLPSTRFLSDLVRDTTTGRIGFISVFFAVYMLSVLLIAGTWKKPAGLIAAPLLATLALLLFWPLQDNPAHLVSWAEMESGSENIRYNALLQIEGYAGNRNQRVSVSGRMGIPRTGDVPPPTVHFDSLQPGVQSLIARIHPFTRHRYRFQGSLASPLQLQLEVASPLPKVTNLGDRATPAGLLSWNETVYAVPSLPPGRVWMPSGPGQAAEPSELTKRLRQRAGAVKAALLLPMTLKDAGLIAPDSGLDRLEGWLLIRPSGDLS